MLHLERGKPLNIKLHIVTNGWGCHQEFDIELWADTSTVFCKNMSTGVLSHCEWPQKPGDNIAVEIANSYVDDEIICRAISSNINMTRMTIGHAFGLFDSHEDDDKILQIVAKWKGASPEESHSGVIGFQTNYLVGTMEKLEGFDGKITKNTPVYRTLKFIGMGDNHIIVEAEYRYDITKHHDELKERNKKS